MGGISSVSQPKHHEPTYTQDVAVSGGRRFQNHAAGVSTNDEDTVLGDNLTENFEARNSFDVAGEGGIPGVSGAIMETPIAALPAPWRVLSANLRVSYGGSFSAGLASSVGVMQLRLFWDATVLTYNTARGGSLWPGAVVGQGTTLPWKNSDGGVSLGLIGDYVNTVYSDAEIGALGPYAAVPDTGTNFVMNWDILTHVNQWRRPENDPLRRENFGIAFIQTAERLAVGTGRMLWGGRNANPPPRMRFSY